MIAALGASLVMLAPQPNLDFLWFIRRISGWALAPMITAGVRELGGVQYAGLGVGLTARNVFTEKVSASKHPDYPEPPW